MKKDNTYDKAVNNARRRRLDGYNAAAVKYGLPERVRRYVELFIRPKRKEGEDNAERHGTERTDRPNH